jgi:hypothetical protein
MWQMTLKQRRRHGELMNQLDTLKRDPYLQVPDGYTFDENPEEDKKYYEALNSFKELVEQIHNVEVAASEQT